MGPPLEGPAGTDTGAPPSGAEAWPRLVRAALGAGRHRLPGLFPRRLRRGDGVGGLPLFQQGLDRRLLHRPGLPLHVLRLRLGEAAGPATGCTCISPCSGLAAAGIMLGLVYRLSAAALLPRLHLRLPARPDALPQPLLPDLADRVPADLPARAPRALARRAAPARDLRSRHRAGLGALAAARPDRRSRTSTAASPSSTATGCAASRCGSGSPRGPTSRSSGRFFTEEWMVYVFAYGGLLLDLLIVPLLLWKPHAAVRLRGRARSSTSRTRCSSGSASSPG